MIYNFAGTQVGTGRAGRGGVFLVDGRGEYLISGGTVLSMEPGSAPTEGADVHIRDGRIVAVETGLDAPAAEVIDAAGMIVMPGLIDSHFHMWSALGRNFAFGDLRRHMDRFDYFAAKHATAEAYAPEDFYASVMLGLVECVSAGITTVHDWAHNIRSREHADALLEAHRDGLLRARFSYGHANQQPADEPIGFAEVDRTLHEWFERRSVFEGLVRLGVNLRGPELTTMSVFDAEMSKARERELPVAIHGGQGRTTAVSAVDLERRGYLGPDFLIAHFLAATRDDLAAMARTGSPLSFAVHSELRLGLAGDPRAALLRMLDAGVTVSLSIDATSLAPVDLFQAMNVAWNMGIPWEGTDTEQLSALTVRRCLEMATIDGARALGLEDETGSISPGKRADVILLRMTDLNMAPVVDVESAVVRIANPANVDSVFVDGRLLKSGGQLQHHSPARIVAEAERAAAHVLQRVTAL